MKVLLVVAAFVAAASAVSYEDVLSHEFNLFKAQYQKTYDNPLENFRRMEIFVQNKYKIAQHNLRYKNGEETYEMEVNEYSDWLPEEIASMNAEEFDDVAVSQLQVLEFANVTAPEKVNWLEKGAVGAVRKQGSCSAGYAISSVGALEAQKFFKTQRMYVLSPQQVVDCSNKQGNQGCKGGNAEKSFVYMKVGVNAEIHYPFEANQGQCRFDSKKFTVKVGEHFKVAAKEEALKEALATKGPIAVAINTPDSFLSYKSGIYSDPKCKSDLKSLTHTVLLVGYATDPNTKQPYWIIRNSYGISWGESGYVKIAMKNNMCGVATFALYPSLAA